MSIAHLSVSGELVSLPELSGGVADEFRYKMSEPSAAGAGVPNRPGSVVPGLGNLPFLADPTYGGRYVAGVRGRVCRIQVRDGAACMQLAFRGHSRVSTFVTDVISDGHEVVTDLMEGSVLQAIGKRTVWDQVAPSVMRPRVVGADHKTPAEAVACGDHVAIVAARLAAFMVEHALVPYTSRLRTPEPSACYWWTGQPTRDQSIFSIRQAEAMAEFARPEVDNNRVIDTQVVYTGQSTKLRGMALLAALGRTGGPVYNQRSELLDAFPTTPRVLLVGDAFLGDRLPNIQSEDMWSAIQEAVLILEEHNNFSAMRLSAYVHAICNNLLVLNTTLLREADNVAHVQTSLPGAPLARRVPIAAVDAVLDPLIAASPFDDPLFMRLDMNDRRAYLHDVYRDELLAIPPNAGIYGDDDVVAATYVIADLLLLGATAPVLRPGMLGAFPAAHRVFSHITVAAAAPAGPFYYGDVADYANHWVGFAGRSLYSVYVVHADPVGGGPLPIGLGAAVGAGALLVSLNAIVAPPAGSSWYPALPPFRVPQGSRCAVVYHNPVDEANTPLQWELPADSPSGFGFAVAGMNIPLGGAGQGDWMRRHARALHRIATQHMDNFYFRALVDCAYTHAGNPIFEPTSRAASFLQAAGGMWWMRNRGAMRAMWVSEYRAAAGLGALVDYAIPDEFFFYLGGVKAAVTLPSVGGLWCLAFLKRATTEERLPTRGGIITEMQMPRVFARYLLYARAATEAASLVLHIGESRLGGGSTQPTRGLAVGTTTYVYGRANSRLLVYTKQEGGCALFASRALGYGDAMAFHLIMLNALPGSTLYLAPLRVVPGQSAEAEFHRLWVRPEVLTQQAIAFMLGVARPSYRASHPMYGYLQEVDWQGRFIHLHEVAVPFDSYAEDVSTDLALYYLTASSNDDWAVKSWLPSGAPNNAVIQVPFALAQNMIHGISRLESRTVFPFKAEIFEIQVTAAPVAFGNPVLAAGAWDAAGLEVLSRDVGRLPVAIRNVNVPPFTHLLAPTLYVRASHVAITAAVRGQGHRVRLVTTAQKRFFEKCLTTPSTPALGLGAEVMDRLTGPLRLDHAPTASGAALADAATEVILGGEVVQQGVPGIRTNASQPPPPDGDLKPGAITDRATLAFMALPPEERLRVLEGAGRRDF